MEVAILDVIRYGELEFQYVILFFNIFVCYIVDVCYSLMWVLGLNDFLVVYDVYVLIVCDGNVRIEEFSNIVSC